MGTVITSTGIYQNGKSLSFIDLAATAAEQCLARAKVDKQEIDLLISTGIYRDHNVLEPAMAALVQQRLGMNLHMSTDHKTFAFDILNGSCGLLSATQAAGAMLANGKIRRVLIVSSDVHPSKSVVKDFPYSSIGAAMLLEWSDDPAKGFQAIDFKTSPSHYVGIKGCIDLRRRGFSAMKSVDVHIEPDYTERMYHFTVETIKDLLNHYKKRFAVSTAMLKLVPTHLWRDFGRSISQHLGLRACHPECLYKKYGNPNSAALTIAYHEALTSGRIHPGDKLMFLAASSGLNVGAGLYFT
jgi:3-oxoacyl-[acyl-carrier-protein] synthase III